MLTCKDCLYKRRDRAAASILPSYVCIGGPPQAVALHAPTEVQIVAMYPPVADTTHACGLYIDSSGVEFFGAENHREEEPPNGAHQEAE